MGSWLIFGTLNLSMDFYIPSGTLSIDGFLRCSGSLLPMVFSPFIIWHAIAFWVPKWAMARLFVLVLFCRLARYLLMVFLTDAGSLISFRATPNMWLALFVGFLAAFDTLSISGLLYHNGL